MVGFKRFAAKLFRAGRTAQNGTPSEPILEFHDDLAARLAQHGEAVASAAKLHSRFCVLLTLVKLKVRVSSLWTRPETSPATLNSVLRVVEELLGSEIVAISEMGKAKEIRSRLDCASSADFVQEALRLLATEELGRPAGPSPGPASGATTRTEIERRVELRHE